MNDLRKCAQDVVAIWDDASLAVEPAIEALRAALAETPEWWVLVPKRPTQKMCEEVAEFDKRLSVFQACDIYTIMLAAAPKPEVK